jgi:catechol 2,3-dioxygenase-like lactoylglutathione lyase family enzyme
MVIAVDVTTSGAPDAARPGGGVVMLTNKSIMPILPVVDLPRARAFYEQRLGLLPEPDGITARGVVYQAGHGTKLEIDLRDRPSKAEHTAISFEVDDLEREVTDLERHGVRFEDYDLPGVEDRPSHRADRRLARGLVQGPRRQHPLRAPARRTLALTWKS